MSALRHANQSRIRRASRGAAWTSRRRRKAASNRKTSRSRPRARRRRTRLTQPTPYRPSRRPNWSSPWGNCWDAAHRPHPSPEIGRPVLKTASNWRITLPAMRNPPIWRYSRRFRSRWCRRKVAKVREYINNYIIFWNIIISTMIREVSRKYS